MRHPVVELREDRMDVDKSTHTARTLRDLLPSLTVVIAWLLAIPVEKWLAFFGVLFLVLQMIGYLWRLKRDMRREQERIDASRVPTDTTDRVCYEDD